MCIRDRLEGLMRKSRLSLDEAKEKYPDWYERRIIKKEPVSYTHLDVYKRQVPHYAGLVADLRSGRGRADFISHPDGIA